MYLHLSKDLLGFHPGIIRTFRTKTTSSDRLFGESKNHISSSWDSLIENALNIYG